MMPVFRPVADHALLVEFGERIDDDIHSRVRQLDHALSVRPFPGFREAIPALVNLLVDFDPLMTDHAQVEAAVRALIAQPAGPPVVPAPREVEICYEGARDLTEVAERTGLTEEAVIAAHLAGSYRVFMYGFAPGYAYLNGVPAVIRLDRKPAPVRDVPAGSVIVAGAQCLITTLTMPTGWWIIGQSPTPVLRHDPDRPFLFDVGDAVRFRRIGRSAFEARRKDLA